MINKILDNIINKTISSLLELCQVKIVLTETPTIFLLDLRGTAVASDAPDYQEVKSKNETYAELLKNRAGACCWLYYMLSTYQIKS